MTNILCIGTAVVDIMASPIPSQDNWQEKQRISDIRLRLGGDAANQSIHLADLGWNPHLAAAIGTDSNGTFLRNLLQQRGVSTRYLAEKADIPTGTSLVLVDAVGNRNTFSVSGAHSTLTREDLPELFEVQPKLISIASLFSLPLLESHGLEEYLKAASSSGVLITADLGSDKKNQGLEGIRVFLPFLDYFWPSDYDALKMTKKTSIEDAADVYLSYGCKNVVIKCGAKGCYYANKTLRGWIPTLPITPVDTTGAGDCMAALMIDQILQEKDLKEACRFACTGAALSTLYPGASEKKLNRDEIDSSVPHIG